MDGLDALGRADAHDGAGDDVRRGDWQVQERRREDDDGRVQVGRESMNRVHLENLAADGADDFPAADARAECHRRRAEQQDRR